MTRIFARPQTIGMGAILATMVLGTATAAQAEPNRWTLGAGVGVVPRFQGADKYKAQPLPLVDIQVGRFFARGVDEIGVNVVDTPRFKAGASVSWMHGYDSDDVPEGIDGVDDALGARLFVSTQFRGAVARLTATQAVTETDRGLLVNASLAYPIRTNERLTITPSLGTTWANAKYMDSYFGVDAPEAAASGLRRHNPSSGFKDIFFRISASYRITDSISALGSIGVTHLLGDAADSPFVEQKTQPLALMGLTYTF
ncbi:MipA/OmpV family protein [Telmatospirillum sp. J64-1]|uniref:MipA/OmpV family protein n=1 Tax=Telmatospirillum sp. J64-1 TaxID=2502183 RepID=UPI00115E17F2|nr:MipA/OmpV family protein [Telmatospirillum sp. J64-1]